MALSLILAAEERNDSKLVTLTDNSTGWGTETDPSYTDISSKTGATTGDYSLVMAITVNTPTSIVVYDEIDLYDLSGPFTTQDDLVFEIDATVLKLNNTSIGSTSTLLEDGVWDIVYKVQYYDGNTWSDVKTLSTSVLITGQISKAVYNKLRLVPIAYNSTVCKIRDIKEAELYYTFLQSIEKNAYIARKTELLEMLETLQRLLTNGSNYPW